MKVGRILALIFGIIIALVAFALMAAGGVLTWAHTQRDADGFISTSEYRLETADYALVSGDIDLAVPDVGWWPTDLLDARFEAGRPDSGEVFMGVGPTDDVTTYLSDVGYTEVTKLGSRQRVEYDPHAGGAPAEPPGEQTFWAATAAGPGVQTLNWQVERGSWTVVVMNADAAPGIAVDFTAAAKVDWLLGIGLGLLLGGLLIAALAVLLIVWATRRERTAPPPAPAAGTGAPGGAYPAAGPREGAYPAAISGRMDPDLSRGMWLIKWFLAIPHYIVLAFLWAAFVLLSIIAFFAILFTGRYPRGIFDFNVGVLRWHWRVTFYALNPAASDRYPPFTLEDTDYPARLEIAYPERLSRGLVLVKWWLLAIPHYIIVGILTSGLIWWVGDYGKGDDALRFGGGLMGILVFVGLVVLLFSGRYPQGLFDLIMGLNRWVIRVSAYAGLMRDEYPPFRLDMGGADPSGLTSVAPSGVFGSAQPPPPPPPPVG